jgi:hypothetical protein
MQISNFSQISKALKGYDKETINTFMKLYPPMLSVLDKLFDESLSSSDETLLFIAKCSLKPIYEKLKYYKETNND